MLNKNFTERERNNYIPRIILGTVENNEIKPWLIEIEEFEDKLTKTTSIDRKFGKPCTINLKSTSFMKIITLLKDRLFSCLTLTVCKDKRKCTREFHKIKYGRSIFMFFI